MFTVEQNGENQLEVSYVTALLRCIAIARLTIFIFCLQKTNVAISGTKKPDIIGLFCR